MKEQVDQLIEEIQTIVDRLLRRSISEKIEGDSSGKVTGVQLDKNCPSAARERLSMAHDIAASNEKEIRSEMELLRGMIETNKRSGIDSSEYEAKYNALKEKRKIATENMSKLESIESDYATKFKPSDNKYDQRAHAMFLEQSRKRLEARKAEAESASMPDFDRIEALDRRIGRIDSAQKESRAWLESNDKGWIAMSDRAKQAEQQESGKQKVKGSQTKTKTQTGAASPQVSGGTGAAQAPSVSGTTGAADGQPTTNTGKKKKVAAVEPKPEEKSGMAQRAVESNPGDVWKTKTGFGAKNQSGSVGSTKGVRYFKDEQDAKVFSGIGTSENPRRKAPDRKPVQKKPKAQKSEKPKLALAAGDFAGDLIGKRLKNLSETYRDSGLGKWFRQSADGTPGWDRYNTKGERIGKCGDADEGEAYAACLSPEKAQKLGKEGIASFVRRKRSAQRKAGMGKKGEGESGGGAEPVRVSTGVNKVDEEWSKKYKNSIDCANPKGFSQRAHCQGKEKNMQEGKEVSIEEMKQAIEDLIALIKKHEKFAHDAKKAGNTTEYKKHRGHVAEFSADIKTVQDMIKRALRDNRTGLVITEEDAEAGKPLNKPFRTPGEKKKFAVYTKNDNGNVVKVRFGDPNMSIKRDDPERLKAFRSRHSCDDNVGPKWKARYWSCQMWRSDKSVNDILGEATENEPTNPELWAKVQDLVAGRSSSMEHGGKTITGPNNGKGFDVHPSAYSNAWASKLYKSLGGGWRKKETVKEQMNSVVESIVTKRIKK